MEWHFVDYHVTFCISIPIILKLHVRIEMQPSCINTRHERGVLFLQRAPRNGTSSQNSALLYDQCRTVWEPESSSMDANATVLWHFVMTTHISPVYVSVELVTILDMFPTQHQFCQILPQQVSSARFHTVQNETSCSQLSLVILWLRAWNP